MNMEKLLQSRILVCTLLAAVAVGHVAACPASNVTLEHILKGNAQLRLIHEELEPLGFLSAEGLRNLITKLLVKTSCPPEMHQQRLPAENESPEHNERDRESVGNGSGHLHHEDHEHDGHDHGENEEDGLDHGESEHSAKMVDSVNFVHQRNDLNRNKISSTESLKDKDRQPSPLSKGSMDAATVSGTKNCNPVEDVISRAEFEDGDASLLRAENFLQLCPSILNLILKPSCLGALKAKELSRSASTSSSASQNMAGTFEHGYDHKGHNHHHRHVKGHTNQMTRDAWIAAIVSLVLIGLISFGCIMVIPVLKRSRYYVLINHFLLALAVGSLAGDALIHLLPHAMTMEIQMSLNGHLVHALYGFTSFLGILLFLMMERIHDLLGHKHSHGHSHDSPATVDGDELIKEIGIISAELNESSVAQRFDKIGEKLSQHSKHSSFILAESTSPSETHRGCFESCPPNLGSVLEDANGNNGNVDSMVCKPRVVDHTLASLAECERLVNSQPPEKTDQISSSKAPLAPIPPPPLIQSSPPKSLVRQDSKNFNMVLQEYHVGHHGHSHHGHSHVTGKKDSLRTMILLGDGMHTFMDGMAIGAAFGTSLTGGIATAIAVLCHELPHKVGDFAILFEMGMKRKQAIKMAVILWVLSLMGLALGVSIGSIQEVSPWIYCFTAGVFLYLALVDLLSELSINDTELCSAANQMALQVAGMVTGAAIMLIIAIYEHDLEHMLEGAF